jgi:NodT family efflux transporter outer membrane factor (OMF) lipoprotein
MDVAMPIEPTFLHPQQSWRVAACIAAALLLAGCRAGPAYVKPAVQAPADFGAWHGGGGALRVAGAAQAAPLPVRWWEAFGDPVLDRLEREALAASPDLRSAALNFAQARLQRGNVAIQGSPTVDLNSGITRQRQSEFGASTRLADVIGGDRDRLASLLAEPYTLYQAGFDVSWEPDLWGRVRRAVEAADADVARQAALFDLARLTLTGEVARRYLELRTTQRQIRLLEEDVAALRERQQIIEARVANGALDHFDLDRQSGELAALRAQLPALQAQEALGTNQLTLLLGKHPGELQPLLAQDAPQTAARLPDLSLGLPSEVAARRPDIRSAEAQLRRATADIGIAQADLYPSIHLGARAGLESYASGAFSDWRSRTWSIGPSLDLPLFDRGRRRRVVAIRELEQQKAAVDFHRTVLRAWQEIDDALSSYAAERQQGEELARRVASARDAYGLAQARYDGGTVDFTAVIDAQRAYVQARRDSLASSGRQAIDFVVVNKALGNTAAAGPAQPEPPHP